MYIKFSQLGTSFATSSKCFCTLLGHMTKIKTLLNILLRIIEHNNRLPDHLFFYRLYKEFKQRMRVSTQTFNYILTEIGKYIEKTLTNLNPASTPTHVQLALTLYRLEHGCS